MVETSDWMAFDQEPVGQSSEGVDPLELSEDDDFIYYLRTGGELLQSGRPEEARLALEHAYELKPENPKAQNLLGLAYFKLGLLEAAKSIYDRLVRDYPSEPPLHVNLGLVLLRQGRIEEAERSLRTALALAPTHVRAHCYLGLVLYRRGALVAARDHFIQGDAPEFARKVEKKLLQGASGGPSQRELLRAVAEAGVSGLGAEVPFRGIDAATDESLIRDEDAWEARVGHKDDAERVSPLVVPRDMALSSVPIPASPPEPSEPPVPSAPSRLETRRPLGSIPIEITAPPRVEPEVPSEIAFGELPGEPAWSSPPAITSRIPVAVRRSPPDPIRTPSVPPPPRLDGVESDVPTSAPPFAETRDVIPVSLGPFPRIPLVEPALRLYTDLPWVPGFSTGPDVGPDARLSLAGGAYLRSSAVVAGSGEMRFDVVMRREAHRPTTMVLGGADDPICRVEGRANLLLRVPGAAATLREAEDLIVRESCLMGFDDSFGFENARVQGLEVVKLSGTGTILVDGRSPLVATISPGEPLCVTASQVLAWTPGLDVTPLIAHERDGARLLQFHGQGLVIFASPPAAP